MASSDLFSSIFDDNIGASPEDISGFQKQVAANDIWRTVGSALEGIKFNTATWSPTEIGTTGLVQGLLSGILKGVAQHNEASQLESVASVLPSMGLSTATPEGVDPQAFAALKLANATRKDDTVQAIKAKAITELFARRPDVALTALGLDTGRADLSPEKSELWDKAGGDPILYRKLVEQAQVSQTTLQGLSNATSMIKELEGLKSKRQTSSNWLPEWTPDYAKGALNAIAAKVDPGSDSATFNSAVIPISDSLLRALTQVGRGSQYNLEKIITDLSDAWGKGPDALAARVRNYQEDLLIGAQQRASDLVNNDYTRARPIYEQLKNMNLDQLAGVGSSKGSAPNPKDFSDKQSFITAYKAWQNAK